LIFWAYELLVKKLIKIIIVFFVFVNKQC
jgi:hypothetical protein